MTLTSMTGFGQADGSHGDLAWRWELRSVNARGLDIRLRLGSGFEALDPPVRERLRKSLQRGSVSVGLQARRTETDAAMRVNPQMLDAVLTALDAVAVQTGQAKPDRAKLDPMRLIAMRGVLETADTDAGLGDAESAALLASFDAALQTLVSARAEEGARLDAVVGGQIDTIEALTTAARADPSRTPDAIRARLSAQIEKLMDADGQRALDADRLAQEVALLATKADIQEELDRLDAHVEQARSHLRSGASVGRKLDFLAQEFNREANTLCSKSTDVSLTRIGLDLKAVIDQLREQVQNIE